MGVLACDRDGCENVMCSRSSVKYGRICYECFDELVEKGGEDIEDFMHGPKLKRYQNTTDDAWERLNKEFPWRYNSSN